MWFDKLTTLSPVEGQISEYNEYDVSGCNRKNWADNTSFSMFHLIY